MHSHQVQNFLRQRGTATLQKAGPICRPINFDRKGTEIVHLFPKIHIPLWRAAPLRPPKIIYH